MNPHSVFYYPYATLGKQQKPLLNAAALYFDKIYILDPDKANWDGIGLSPLDEELKLLQEANILERITPEEILVKYEASITNSIEADLRNQEFLDICKNYTHKRYWTLALSKIPENLQQDQTVQNFMRTSANRYVEKEVYDEYRLGYEYRYADFPLEVGEAIMINHALHGGLLHTKATPITDDTFHNMVLNLKIEQIREIPKFKEIFDDMARVRDIKRNIMAIQTLTDRDLGIITDLPMESLLKCRTDNKKDLKKFRDKLGWLSREVVDKPWTDEFSDKLYSETIPEINDELKDIEKQVSDYIREERAKLIRRGIGLTAGTIVAVLSFSFSPLIPIAIAIGASSLVKDVAIPGLDWYDDWKQGKQIGNNNGLSYLLKIKELSEKNQIRPHLRN